MPGPYVYSLMFGMTVNDVSGKAIANLATDELSHPNPVFHGDTLFVESEVLEVRPSRVEARPRRGQGPHPRLQPGWDTSRGVQAGGVGAAQEPRIGGEMVNFRSLADRAKKVVDKRGGTDALKEDAEELKDIATSKGSVKDKAKAAGEAIKDPAPLAKRPRSHPPRSHPVEPLSRGRSGCCGGPRGSRRRRTSRSGSR